MKASIAIIAVVVLCVSCEDIIVSTAVGNIKGYTHSFSFAGQPYNVSAFLGVPYAETTEGAGRFAKPVKKAPFEGIYDATSPKPACLQNIQWSPGLETPTSEDCLILNIFVPSRAKQGDKKAVMIFIYGGGFQFGMQDSFITGTLSAVHDVLFVTFNYRVSAYGFLSSKKHALKGNYGLWDQHMCIKWVHDNIAAFGGDPGAITIFGESAGAVSAMYQALYDGNKGLFQRVIAQSGAAGAFWGFNKYPDLLYDKLAEAAGCKTAITDCLRNLSDEDMQRAFIFGDMYLPVQDGEFVKYNPETFIKNLTKEATDALSSFAEKDVIIGLNSDEGHVESMLFMYIFMEDMANLYDGLTKEEMKRFFGQVLKYNNQSSNDFILTSLMHQYTDWLHPNSKTARRSSYLKFVKDVQYTLSTIQMLNRHSAIQNQGHTFMYHFEHKPSFSHTPDWVTGADHTEEIPFVFGFPNIYMRAFKNVTDDAASTMPANELTLSRAMMKYWTQFAKTGNPNDPIDSSVQQWPQYEHMNQTYIRFVADVVQFPTGNHFRNEYVNYWEEIFPTLVNMSTLEDKGQEPCYTAAASTLNTSFLHYILFLLTYICYFVE